MARSVYSLVLDDDVVREVDRLAYAAGTNRSAMINRILADYCSCTTPEKRMRLTFDELEKRMDAVNGFRLQLLPSESMMSIQSALCFKYNPVIRYTVELYRENDGVAGELRVGFRTQNRQLIEAFHGFLQVWARMETVYIGRYFANCTVPYRIENSRYQRPFRAPEREMTSAELGKAIAQYIRMFDAVLKVYFAHIDHPDGIAYTEDAYRTALKQMDWII